MRPLFTRRSLLAGAAALAGLAPLAQAQAAATWPAKPLRFIVGFPAGSSPDLTARALAEPLEKELGQPVVVENRVGADVAARAQAVVDHHRLAERLLQRLGQRARRQVGR